MHHCLMGWIKTLSPEIARNDILAHEITIELMLATGYTPLSLQVIKLIQPIFKEIRPFEPIKVKNHKSESIDLPAGQAPHQGNSEKVDVRSDKGWSWSVVVGRRGNV